MLAAGAKRFGPLAAYVLLALALLWPYRSPEFRRGGDLSAVLGLTVESAGALGEGQFPIRTVQNQPTRPGYPLFQYYGNYPYTITGLISLLTGANPYTAWKLASLLAFVCGAVAVERFTYYLTRRRGAAVIAAVVFLLAPYQFADLNARGAFSEQVAFNLLPAAFYFSLRAFASHRRWYIVACAVAWTLVGMSHNVIYLYGVLFAAALLVSLKWWDGRHKRRITTVAVVAALHACLIAWYFVPQVLTLHALDISNAPYNPTRHTDLTPLRVLLSPKLTETAASASAPGLGLQVGWPILLGVLLAVGACVTRRTRRPRAGMVWRLTVLFAIALLVVWTPFDFWRYLPRVLWMVQYAYRALVFVVLFGAVLCGIAAASWWPGRRPGMLTVALVPILFAVPFVPPAGAQLYPTFVQQQIERPDIGPQALEAYLLTPRFLAKTSAAPVTPSPDWEHTAQTLAREVHATDGKTTLVFAERHEMTRESTSDFTVTVARRVLFIMPVLYYPHMLEVRNDGEPTAYTNVGYYLATRLRPGSHRLTVRFVGVWWANAISALAWSLVAVVGAITFVRRSGLFVLSPRALLERRCPQRNGTWVNAGGWGLVTVLVLAQFGLFRQYMLRNVVWNYPPNHDQLTFLEQSYIGYEKVLELGPRKGFEKELNLRRPKPARRPGVVVLPQRPTDMSEPPPMARAVGLMLPLQATTLYFMAGPGRMAALSLNFIYFAIFQVALVAVAKRLSGRWSVAFIALGLLLCALTPFFWAGGLGDFRLDFAGFCLFGTFICVVMRSRVFADRRWSIVAGLVGGLLFTVRFITIVYLGGVLGIVTVFLAVRAWRRRGDLNARRRTVRQFHNALIACGIIACVALPIVATRWHAIKTYYVVGHVTGQEKQVRAREQGIETWRDAVAFYPRSLWENHAGRTMLRWCGYVLAGGLLAFVARRATRSIPARPAALDGASAWLFVGACLAVPLTALTLDTAKSPVVADIMVAPIVWLVLLAIVVLSGTDRDRRPPLPVRIGLIALAVCVLREGMVLQFNHSLKRPRPEDRAETEKLLTLYDRIARDSAAMGWDAPAFAFDSTSDALNFRAFEVTAFERGGRVFTPSEVLANTIFRRSPGELEHRLECADFVVLSEAPAQPPSPYEFDRGMQILKPHLFAWCRTHLVELSHEHLGFPFDREVTLFVRPAVQVEGDRDGWIGRTGARVTALAEVLRQKPGITLWGKNAATYLGGVAPRPTARMVGDTEQALFPASVRNEGDTYRLEIRTDPRQLPEHGQVTIELSFDASFVPRKVNGSPDDRELVMRLPEGGSLQPADQSPTQASARP